MQVRQRFRRREKDGTSLHRASDGPTFRVRKGENAIPNQPPPKRHPYDQWTPDARALDLVGDKWTLLIVRDLAGGPRRFVELQRVLPGISTEQLRSRLNRMVADGLLTRQRYREVPPRVDYELTERARDLLPVVGALARWGLRWSWGAPRDGERVDVGAILRAMTGLPVDAALRGTLEVVVAGRRPEDELRATLTAEDGALRYAERDLRAADTTVTGDREAWVHALGPDGSAATLQISGDGALARALLEHLHDATPRVAAVA